MRNEPVVHGGGLGHILARALSAGDDRHRVGVRFEIVQRGFQPVDHGEGRRAAVDACAEDDEVIGLRVGVGLRVRDDRRFKHGEHRRAKHEQRCENDAPRFAEPRERENQHGQQPQQIPDEVVPRHRKPEHAPGKDAYDGKDQRKLVLHSLSASHAA